MSSLFAPARVRTARPVVLIDLSVEDLDLGTDGPRPGPGPGSARISIPLALQWGNLQVPDYDTRESE
jgi:hypothetical protein